MRHSKGTGTDPYWSAQSGPIERGLDAVTDAPMWALVIASTTVAVLLVLGFLTVRGLWRWWVEGRRRSAALATQQAQARAGLNLPPAAPVTGFGAQVLPALGGVAVSVYGLWGVAAGDVALPVILCVGFIGVFDVAELTLFFLLHRGAVARQGQGWSPHLRRMQALAWTLVGFSAAMNAWHASGLFARLIMASIPILASRLISLQLQGILYGDGEIDDAGGRPGPLRLVVLLWQTGWAWTFARFNLDARATSGAIERATLARRAGRLIYELRVALARQTAMGDGRRAATATKSVERLRDKAQQAMELAQVGPNRAQTLAVLQNVATRVRVKDLANAEYTDPSSLGRLAEELEIVPAVQRREADDLLAEAEALRKAAASDRKTAEDERAASREEVADMKERLREMTAQAEIERKAAAVAGKLRAEATAEREDAERAQRLLTKKLEVMERRIQESTEALETTEVNLQKARAAETGARERAAAAGEAEREAIRRREAEEAAEAAALTGAEVARRTAAEAAALLRRLGRNLEDVVDLDGKAEPEWGSAEKREAWPLYLESVSSGAGEPPVVDFAERFDKDPRTIRIWWGHFREVRARQLVMLAGRTRGDMPTDVREVPAGVRPLSGVSSGASGDAPAGAGEGSDLVAAGLIHGQRGSS